MRTLVRRLTSTDVNVANAARATVAGLAQDALAVRLEALRALTADALSRDDRTEGARWATQLKSEKETSFSDALLYFQAVQGTEAGAGLAADQGSGDPAQTTAELIAWLNRHGLAQVAAQWRSSLSPKFLETHARSAGRRRIVQLPA